MYQETNKQKYGIAMVMHTYSPTINLPNNMIFVCIYPFKAAHLTKSNVFLDSDDLTVLSL